MVHVLEIDKTSTSAHGRKFRDKGPSAPEESGADRWCDQQWRSSGKRWGNRYVKNKEYWAVFHKGKCSPKGII